MAEKPLMIDDNPPGMVIAGSGHEYGSVNLNTVMEAVHFADDARKLAGTVNGDEEIQALRQSVENLSDALRLLAGELYQVGHAVEYGRIAVIPLDA